MGYNGRYFKGKGVSRGKRSKRSSGSSRKTRKAVPKPSSTMVKQVEKIIHKNAENFTAYTALPLTACNSAISVANDIFPVVPQITQGIQDNNRRGDEFRGQKLRIKGHIILSQGLSTTPSNCRLAVRLLMVQPKAYNNFDAISANYGTWMPALLRKGGTNVGYTGIVSDIYADINRENVTVHYDKTFYMTLPYFAVSTSVGIGVQDLQKSTRFFSITKKLNNKLLKLDSAYNSGTTPVNFSPVILLGYTHLDGSTPDSIETQVSIAFDSYLEYEDL